MAQSTPARSQPALARERWRLLLQLDALLDGPLTALAFVWLALLVLDLTTGLTPLLQTLGDVIWALFIVDFAIGIVVAPDKGTYLRRNWLTAVSLLLPALRVLRVVRAFRLLRAARAVRSASLARLLTSLNRGARAIRQTLGRRGVGYAVALTAIVTATGAAGMASFESPAALAATGEAAAGPGLASYGEALWYTAMLMTTLGSDYWPRTAEGRVLTWLLAVYAFAIFGYITANIASYFLAQDQAGATPPGPPRDGAAATALHAELAALRQEVAALRAQLPPPPPRDGAASAPEPRVDGPRTQVAARPPD
jgi:voltage-gated potassium channel